MSQELLNLVRNKWHYAQPIETKCYLRDSGGDDQDESVVQQEAMLRAFIEYNALPNSGYYCDEHRVSSTTENRDALSRLMTDIERKFPHIPSTKKRAQYGQSPRCVVLVWKGNRLSRDEEFRKFIRADWAMRGVALFELMAAPSTGHKFTDTVINDLNDHTDSELLKGISEDAKRGQALNLMRRDTDADFRAYHPDWPTSDGRYLSIADGRPPMGFKGEAVRIGTNERKRTKKGGAYTEYEPHIVQRLVPDPATWELCQLAWKMRHEGKSLRAIHQAVHLFKTVKSYAPFFRNRIYAGDYEHGGYVYEAFVPALVSKAQFEEEQSRRQERAKKCHGQPLNPRDEPRRVASPYLLSGKLFCVAKTGSPHTMHGHTVPANQHRTLWASYECSVRKNTHQERCCAPSISARALEQSVLELIFGEVITRANLRPLADELVAYLSTQHTELTTQLDHLKARIAEKESTIQKLLDLIESDSTLPSTALLGRLKAREKEKAELVLQKRQLEVTGNTPVKVETVSDAALDDYIAHVRHVLFGQDVQLGRQILNHFVAKIDVITQDRQGTLFYTFPVADLSPVRTPSPEGFRVGETEFALGWENLHLTSTMSQD